MKNPYIYEPGTVRWRRFNSSEGDVRGYRPPKGWDAEALTPEYHPITGRPIRYQWWIKETFTGETS